MPDACIAGDPVERWERIMHWMAETMPGFRGLRAEPIEPPLWDGQGIGIRWHGYPGLTGRETRWPAMQVSGPRDEEDGYARW